MPTQVNGCGKSCHRQRTAGELSVAGALPRPHGTQTPLRRTPQPKLPEDSYAASHMELHAARVAVSGTGEHRAAPPTELPSSPQLLLCALQLLVLRCRRPKAKDWRGKCNIARSSGELRRRVPVVFFFSVYFSRGTLPKKGERRALPGDLDRRRFQGGAFTLLVFLGQPHCFATSLFAEDV